MKRPLEVCVFVTTVVAVACGPKEPTRSPDDIQASADAVRGRLLAQCQAGDTSACRRIGVVEGTTTNSDQEGEPGEADVEAFREQIADEIARENLTREQEESERERQVQEANARALERVQAERAARDAAAQEDAKHAPPWFCWAGVIQPFSTRIGMCQTDLRSCEKHLAGLTLDTLVHGCQAQPLAACVSVVSALQGEELHCLESFAACENIRRSFFTTDGKLTTDHPGVGVCEATPTSWISATPR